MTIKNNASFLTFSFSHSFSSLLVRRAELISFRVAHLHPTVFSMKSQNERERGEKKYENISDSTKKKKHVTEVEIPK